MTDWASFPSRTLGAGALLYRVHQKANHPAWFNSDGTCRFDPPPSHRGRFGSCYCGLTALAGYVEVFGRFRAVPEGEVRRRVLSILQPTRELVVADLTRRRVLGDFGITGAHSTGADYEAAQDLAGNLFDAGFDGVVYRIRHDPAMLLEAVAVFGEPGEAPDRFAPPKAEPIADGLVADGREFHIEVIPAAALP